jgi:SAM-dependent methyltransferase
MPAGRFTPGIIDYDDVSARYQPGRALSGEAAKTWSAAVMPFIQDSACPRILDLGAGTGRFAALFALSLDVTVIGVEPSTGMVAVAARQEKPNNLAYLAGTAERIPLADATSDLAWLSHVWHHIRDHQACARDVSRVLRRGGHALVRGTFGDRLDGFPTLFEFWRRPGRSVSSYQRSGKPSASSRQTGLRSFNTSGSSNRQQPALASSQSGHSPVPIPPSCSSRILSSKRGKLRLKQQLRSDASQSPWLKSSNFWCSERAPFEVLPNTRLQPSAAGEIMSGRG